MFSPKLTRFVAAGAAAVAIAVGGLAIGNSTSGNGASGAPNAVPQNWSPGTGTIVTGAAADKAKAAAVAKYPGGVVNRVLKLSDGSYAVHRIGTSGQHHIFISQDVKVTGIS